MHNRDTSLKALRCIFWKHNTLDNQIAKENREGLVTRIKLDVVKWHPKMVKYSLTNIICSDHGV